VFSLTRSLTAKRTAASLNHGDDLKSDDNDTSSDEDLLAEPIFRSTHRSPSLAQSSGSTSICLPNRSAAANNPTRSAVTQHCADQPSSVQDAIKQGIDDWTTKMERQRGMQHFPVYDSQHDQDSSPDVQLRKNKTRRTAKNPKMRKTNQCISILLFSAFLLLEVVASFTPQPMHTWPSALKASTSKVTDTETQNDQSSVWDELLSRFQGDFDNYFQVVQDRSQGLVPREGGGHEHIHCCLVPVSRTSRLAAFYFDGNPTAIFRFRFYRLVPDKDKGTVDTILYTLDPALEIALRNCANPLEWKELFQKENGFERVTELKDCDVRWSWTMDPVQHSYAASHVKDHEGIHAVMVHGEALVESQLNPGVQILIRDQLSLWEDELWIHDRGFDPKTMDFIYGNQREIPYCLQRVSNIKPKSSGSNNDDLVRSVNNIDLQWTIGPTYRTEDEYDAKMMAIGGPSRPQRIG
jgi:hypothetical protein